jgi:UDP-glucuronate decarboxylase
MSIVQEDISKLISKINLDYMLGKKILITGASGLIGSYFAQSIQHLCDSKESPSRIFLSSKTGFFQFKVNPNVKVIEGDILKVDLRNGLPMFDVIIHAAGYAQPDKFLSNPLETLELNTSVTIDLIKKVNYGGRFLFISSSEVYSGLSNPQFNENQIGTTNTDHPRSSYIEGKRAGEAIVSAAKSHHNLFALSARLSLAYGPGTKVGDSRVMNSFIAQAINFSKIKMLDAGLANRTYCYVSDAVEMCLNILNNGTDLIYNVGGISKIKIIDLARLIARITNSDLEVPEGSGLSLSGSPEEVSLDLIKTTTLLGKTNFVTLEDGLKRTIEWQKSNLYGSAV